MGLPRLAGFEGRLGHQPRPLLAARRLYDHASCPARPRRCARSSCRRRSAARSGASAIEQPAGGGRRRRRASARSWHARRERGEGLRVRDGCAASRLRRRVVLQQPVHAVERRDRGGVEPRPRRRCRVPASAGARAARSRSRRSRRCARAASASRPAPAFSVAHHLDRRGELVRRPPAPRLRAVVIAPDAERLGEHERVARPRAGVRQHRAAGRPCRSRPARTSARRRRSSGRRRPRSRPRRRRPGRPRGSRASTSAPRRSSGKATRFSAVSGAPPIAYTSESALAAAMRPKSYGSSTIGVKKSTVCTSARSSRSRYTAASSPVAEPTSRRGSSLGRSAAHDRQQRRGRELASATGPVRESAQRDRRHSAHPSAGAARRPRRGRRAARARARTRRSPSRPCRYRCRGCSTRAAPRA